MQGSGLLLLWNDIDPAVDAEYKRWHSREHVPERVTVPGILAGRRYARTDEGTQRYLSVYELESTAVLASKAYLALMEEPTPWSRRMRPHFRNLSRVACRRGASAGAGLGAGLLALRITGTAAGKPEILTAIAACSALDGMVAAHWCEADATVPELSWQSATGPAGRFDRILLVEAADNASLRAARAKIEALAGHAAPGAIIDCGPEYALLQVVHG
ncbi:MAG: hypothetical protein A3H35_03610 [Betaproteobacteria bacterium RIFCSPLOWO2_02_FULL_62_17]|nr:MAG: hypothetical protein A3H35_03610 [Betaproteobacteria bacterium RIFCSPLOWO2_02_FULL_62_17]